MTHIKNAEAFSRLVDFCTGYGGTYNPGRTTLQIDALNTQKVMAADSLNKVITEKSNYDNAVNQRKQLFDRLPKLVASVMRTLEASGASPEKLDDARAYAQQVTGFKSPNVVPALAANAAPAASADKPTVRHTTLQLAYASKADSFARLVNTVATEPQYTPNEESLGVNGLRATLSDLTAANQQVSGARVAWSNARIERNSVMYHQAQSMCSTGRAVKKYVRAVFGPHSQQFAQLKSLTFTKPAK